MFQSPYVFDNAMGNNFCRFLSWLCFAAVGGSTQYDNYIELTDARFSLPVRLY